LLGVAASGPGALIREDGEVMVEANFESGVLAGLPELREAGGDVVSISRRYQTVAVNVPLTDLRQLAAVPGLSSVTPVRAPVTRLAEACRGSVVSEGIPQLRVEQAREEIATSLGKEPGEGEGLTVGVLSDSYNKAEKAVGGGSIKTHASKDIL